MISRRHFSAGALAAPFVLSSAARGQVQADIDLAIVGAGAAGLVAAHRAREKKLTTKIFEAQNRVGGRVYTDETLGAGFEGKRCRLSFVLEGSARLHAGQTAADLRPGQFFFSPDAQQQWTQTDHLEVLELDWEPEALASPMASLPAHGTLGPRARARVKEVALSLSLARGQAPLAFAAQFPEMLEVVASIGASVNRDFRLGEAPQPNEWLFEKVD
jgi:phytoene dehydrogenase-like protein